MDRKLRKILTECIGDIETGARDVEGCLQRHPDRAVELRPHLELWISLTAAPKAQPNLANQQRGQHQLLAALADTERSGGASEMTIFGQRLLPVAAAVLGAVFLLGGLTGASALPGSPVPGPQDAVPFLDGDDGDPALEALEAEHEEEMAALEGDCEARQEALEAEHEAAEEAFQGTDEEKKALEAEHDAAEEALEAECEAAQEALEAEHEAEEEALEAQLEAEEEAQEAADDAAEEAAEEAAEAAENGLNIAEDRAAEEAEDGLDTAEDAVDDPLNNIAEDHAADEAEDGLGTADGGDALDNDDDGDDALDEDDG